MMVQVQLNTLDWDIIKELQLNGREPNSSIAKKLNVTEGTIRQRVKKLLEAGVLRVSGQLNPEFLESHQMVLMGVNIKESSKLQTIFDELSNLDEVHSVAITSGRYDLFIQVMVNNNLGLVDFLTDSLAAIEGISQTETFVLLKTKNYWL
ncbi:MAG: Lrp/AsnC family transcriptional regulator [Lentisphaerales bacterium]|nr:Lrp/AsnC family transcriptional regulator [Lentisphaerales bacterium]